MSVYRYELISETCNESVEIALLLASWGTESLHGTAAARLEAAYLYDRALKVLVVEADSAVGEAFNRLLCGFMEREVGPDAFRVRRLRQPLNKGDSAARQAHHGDAESNQNGDAHTPKGTT